VISAYGMIQDVKVVDDGSPADVKKVKVRA
jgi:hypothetical protein